MISRRLTDLPGLTAHATFGPLEFYRLNDDRFGPRFYVPERAAVFSSAAAIVARPSTGPGLPVYLARADSETAPVKQPETCQTQVTFEQINPTRYRVRADGDCEAYWLVFSSGYDDGWRATVVPAVGPGVRVPDSRHVRANGYANAWRIEQAGPHTLVIEYLPQRVFVGASLISALTLLGVGLAVAWSAARRRAPARTGAA
jgi:hypothetical protein